MHLYTNHQLSATGYAKEEKKANFYKIIIIIIIITITEGTQGYNFQSIFCTSAFSFTSSASHDILYKFFCFTLKVLVAQTQFDHKYGEMPENSFPL